ncbi:ABSCISIC ACID-INSENSITIVE 5-like protein 4 [Rutidosis leptorrhynchoides]|uniref:ABSCISIC ACID-INSENSITIVE 5-like protein 4 n=1 Tax=Rutidosis leptorrhynchoides TaxID=125765 RepID=UPI003A99F391
MNMDEILKNIWTSEETQAMAPISNFGANFQKQGSLNLPQTLGQKMVDEVWKDLHKDVNFIKEPNLQPQEKQPTLCEMTLEDFLHKAGVVGETTLENKLASGLKNVNSNQVFHQNPVVNESKHEDKRQKIIPKQAAFNFTSSLNVVTNPQLGSFVSGKKSLSNLFQNSNLETSTTSYTYGERVVHERKRSGILEKVVERRQKRMIKNRESASRSRARKQAYTLELEAEVAKLKELNHKLLKKQEEIMESQKFQLPEKVKYWGNRRLCLRRTLTGPW